MPIQAIRVIATPRRCAISAAHTGCVATSSTAASPISPNIAAWKGSAVL